MCIHDLHVLENIINLYKDRVETLGKITIYFIANLEEDDVETKHLYDFHNKCNEFINTCKSAINLIHESTKPGNYGNQYKIEKYYGTLTLDISDIEDKFKDLCDLYRKYKLDHMVIDIIFKGEEDEGNIY